MNPSIEADIVAAVLFAAMSAYALLSGADFGGGIWDLLAGGTRQGAAPRALIDSVITPVWEANHVCLVFILVLLWTGFSPAFAAIMTALWVPVSLSLLGVFGRGLGFAFRHGVEHLRLEQVTGFVFAASSLIAPFFFGTIVGAIATGAVPAPATGTSYAAWTSPTALLSGGLFVAACAYVGAIYLVGDARRRAPHLRGYFARRAAASGLTTGLLAAVTFAELSSSAPYVFHNLTGRALPLVAVSGLAGVTALLMIATGRTHGLRIVAAVAVAAVIWGWGWAQYPRFLPGSLSLGASSAPPSTLLALLAVTGLAAALVVPSFGFLLYLQQRDVLDDPDEPSQLRQQLQPDTNRQSRHAPDPPSVATTGEARHRHWPALAVLAAAGATQALRKATSRRKPNNSGDNESG